MFLNGDDYLINNAFENVINFGFDKNVSQVDYHHSREGKLPQSFNKYLNVDNVFCSSVTIRKRNYLRSIIKDNNYKQLEFPGLFIDSGSLFSDLYRLIYL